MTNDLTRRDFSKLVAASPLATASAAGTLPKRPLGKIGFQASILGIGGQRLADRPLEQSVVDRIVHEAIDNGLNYIDTARGYGDSEKVLGHALKGRRDKVFLITKTREATRDGALREVEESLRTLQVDHVDCVHIHNIARDDRYPDLDAALSEKGVLGGLIEAKRKGMTKHIGCTAHLRAPRVLPVFATGQIELFMCGLNFVERYIYNFEDKILPEAKRRGIGVIAMKVLGGPMPDTRGRLNTLEDYQTSLRYVWGLPELSVALIGMRSVDELRQGLAAARSFKPISGEELAQVAERGKLLAKEWGPLRGPVA